jgi:hypothetical protein
MLAAAGAEQAMKRNDPAVRAFSVILILLAAIASACGDDVARSTYGSAVSSTSSTMMATTTPLIAPTPQTVSEIAPLTGVADLDEIMVAALDGDIDTLMTTVAYERMGCVTVGQLGSPVTCPEGVSEGTVLDAFPYAHCDGGWMPPDALRAAFVRSFDGTLTLYAVLHVRSPEPGETYLIVFEESSEPFGRGFWLSVRDGRIVARGGPCVPLAQSDIFVNPIEVLVPPPDER